VTITKTTLYLDQNYLSGIAKRKPAFAELEPILREAVANGTLAVLESKVHARESKPRPDLHLQELHRELSNGHKLPDTDDRAAREARRRLEQTIKHELPERKPRPSDTADRDALAQALMHCDLVTCDAFMADVVKRARLDLHHQTELFSGRRRDVVRLRERIQRGVRCAADGAADRKFHR
jgi:predicted nucleic acid-binding protein